jgi:geranylgeranylglycerol-phosphate geranylgeranyltransferase
MLPYITLIRPLNAFMSSVAVLIGGLLVAGNNPLLLSSPYPLILAMVAVFLITGAGNAINDCFDVDSDSVNKPGRPIPAGRVTRRKALAFSVAVFVLGILLTFLINWACILIAVVNSVLLVVYSYSLQDRILLGNVVIGYLVGSTFLFGGAAFGNLLLPGLLMLLAGLSTVSREIVKDLEDIEGDRKSFLKKLTAGVKMKLSRFVGKEAAALVLNKGRATKAAGTFMFLAIVISPLPYLLNTLSFAYLVILAPADLIFLSSMLMLARGDGRKKFSRISRTIKAGMLLALIAFIFGVLF